MANKNIIWIASYPKSGNTWMRMFLSVLLQETNDFEALKRLSMQCCSKEFHRKALGKRRTDKSKEDGLTWRVKAQKAYSEKTGKKRSIIKTHSAYGFHRGIPLFAPEASNAAVVIVRNPVDVTQSFARHFGMTIDETIRFMFNRGGFIGSVDETSGRSPVFSSSWEENVISWIDQTDIKKIIVRYEDLILDPIPTFTRVANDLFTDITPEKIELAVTETKFDKLKQKEEEEGFHEKSSKNENFFNKGKINTGFEVLNESQLNLIRDNTKYICRKLGYDISGGEVKIERPNISDIKKSDYLEENAKKFKIETYQSGSELKPIDQLLQKSQKDVKEAQSKRLSTGNSSTPANQQQTGGVEATFESEVRQMAQSAFPGPNYLSWFQDILSKAEAKTYLEIGVASGSSLARVPGAVQSIGVDPSFAIKNAIRSPVRLYKETSDAFFARRNPTRIFGKPIDVAFVDGLHTFDQTFRDIVNVGRHCHSKSLVLVHDVAPVHARIATRERTTKMWAGDVWKIGWMIKSLLPKAEIWTIPAYPSGLMVIKNIHDNLFDSKGKEIEIDDDEWGPFGSGCC